MIINSITTDWNKLTRDQQVDWIVENDKMDMGVTINEIKVWCKRHAFEKGYRDPILNRCLSNVFTITERWALALMIMGKLHGDGFNFVHYKNDVMRIMNAEPPNGLGRAYNINNLPRLARKPYMFIEPATKSNWSGDRDGYWRLNQRGYDFVRGKITVPESVLFSVLGDFYEVRLKGKEIEYNNVSKFNMPETIKLLKSF